MGKKVSESQVSGRGVAGVASRALASASWSIQTGLERQPKTKAEKCKHEKNAEKLRALDLDDPGRET